MASSPGVVRAGPILLLAAVLAACGPAPPSLETLLAEARAHHEAGESEAAAGLLEQALGEYPDNADARLQLAAVRLDAGAPDDAVREYRRALRDGASAEAASLPLARAWLAAGKPREALSVIADAPPTTDAEQLAARGLVRARALEADGQAQAAAAFSMLVGTSVGADACAGLGRLALAGGRPRKARDWLKQGRALDPDAVALLWLEAELDDDARDFRSSVRVYRRLADMGASGGPLPASLGLARALIFNGETDEAIALLDEMLAADADDLQAQFHRALAAYRAGDFDAVTRYGERLLAQDPDYDSVYLLLGGALAALGDAPRAQTYLGHHLGAHPRDHDARRLLEAVENGTAKDSPALVEELFFDKS